MSEHVYRFVRISGVALIIAAVLGFTPPWGTWVGLAVFILGLMAELTRKEKRNVVVPPEKPEVEIDRQVEKERNEQIRRTEVRPSDDDIDDLLSDIKRRRDSDDKE